MSTDWSSIQHEYIHSEHTTLKALAQKYALNYNLLKKHSAQNGWYAQKKAAAAKAPQCQPSSADTANRLAQSEKINAIATRLLDHIEQSADVADKPVGIYNLTSALKNLTAILRDVNDIPNIKDERSYVLAKTKLEMEVKKLSADAPTQHTGVIVLPEVKEDG